MKEKNKLNVTNVLLFIISIMIAIIGYYFAKDQIQTNETNTLVKELVRAVDTSNYMNTAQHIVLSGQIEKHVDKATLIYDVEIKQFKKLVEENMKNDNKQDVLIQQNTDRSLENRRRLNRNTYMVVDSSDYWFYGLK